MRNAPRSPSWLLPSLALVIGVGATAPARAQVNAQSFNPAIGPENVITVEGTRPPGALRPMANLFVEFAYQPVRLGTVGGVTLGNPVDTMTTAHVMGGLGLLRWLSLGVDLPIVVYQSAALVAPGQAAPSAFGLGDLRVVPKVRLLSNEGGGFGLALVPQFTFPTGSGNDFRGASRPDRDVYTIEGRLAADYRFQRGAFIALNAGFRGRVCSGLGLTFSEPVSDSSHSCDQALLTDRISHQVTYGLGAYAPLARGFGLAAEVIGATSIARSDVGSYHSPLAGYLAGRFGHRSGLTVTAGGGGAFIGAVGEPVFRVFAAVGYLPFGKKVEKPADRDGDEVPDARDACPDTFGEAAADPARNGCPPDRDGDGVVDARDLCVDTPAGDRPDGKRPGCPLTDKDGDGVFDDTDQCVDAPAGEHPDGKRPGCPLTDQDGDGVFDDVDQCVEVAAGPHPDARKPGCPDMDSDKDGVYDSADACPAEVPGLNPDPARPGCPLPDRDHDLVPDAVDACPDQVGAPSPDPKQNGCPGKVEIQSGRIIIKEEIFFATNKDVIQKKSFAVLEAVAHALRSVTTIKKVAIEGHTDNKGKRDKNVALSDRRAKAVQGWLVAHGVTAERLTARGYGPDRPIADNKTAAGRAQNRRVDFLITDPAQPAAPKAAEDKAPAVADKAPAAPADDADKAVKPGKGEKKEKKAKKEKAKGGKKAKRRAR